MIALRGIPLSQAALAESLAMHPAKLVVLLNDLEAQGLIIRRRDAEDRRRHTVSLSELGRARLAAIDVAREKLDGVLFTDVSHTQRALLASLLDRVAGNLGLPIS